MESSSPGPGAYESTRAIGQAPSYSLSGRHKETVESAAPGPGAYNVDGHIGKGQAHSISGRTEQKVDSFARMLKLYSEVIPLL